MLPLISWSGVAGLAFASVACARDIYQKDDFSENIFDSEDSNTSMVVGIIVGVGLVLVTAALIAGYVYHKYYRNISHISRLLDRLGDAFNALYGQCVFNGVPEAVNGAIGEVEREFKSVSDGREYFPAVVTQLATISKVFENVEISDELSEETLNSISAALLNVGTTLGKGLNDKQGGMYSSDVADEVGSDSAMFIFLSAFLAVSLDFASQAQCFHKISGSDFVNDRRFNAAFIKWKYKMSPEEFETKNGNDGLENHKRLYAALTVREHKHFILVTFLEYIAEAFIQYSNTTLVMCGNRSETIHVHLYD